MKNQLRIGVITFFMVLATISCTQKSEYDKLVERELASNIRQDSLFLGITFEMDRKEFYAHCWDPNKKGVFTNGVGNMSIKYNLESGLKYPGSMQFYPKFGENKIFELPVDFQYDDWALWDKNKSSDALLQDVKNMLEEWYGGSEFMELESEDGTKKVLVKVDGNRRIRLWKWNVSTVRVIFTDLIDLQNFKEAS